MSRSTRFFSLNAKGLNIPEKRGSLLRELWRERTQIAFIQETHFETGGTIQGVISDVIQKRSPVLAISLVFAVGSLFGYSHSPNNKAINALLMTITGFFIGGPSNMISSAISADLGRQEMVRGSSEALATVTGIVDGTGSVGAALGQVLVSLIQYQLTWMWVFYFFILMIFLTFIFIIPLTVRELRPAWRNRRASRLDG